MSRLSSWSTLVAAALVAATTSSECAPVAAKVNLRVFATGDLPDWSWFILQAVEGDKPLLEPTEKKKRGDSVWFIKSAETPLYRASLQVQDAAKFNLSFVQIESMDNRLVNHVVICREYKHLKFALGRYLAGHGDVSQLDIDARVNTRFLSGSQGRLDGDVLDNSTCNVTYMINGVDMSE